MNEIIDRANTVAASVRRRRRIPAIWIIPLLAVAIGAVARLGHAIPRRDRPSPSRSTARRACSAGQSQLKFKDIDARHGEEADCSPATMHA